MLINMPSEELKKYKLSQNNINSQKHIEIMPFYEHSWETILNFGEKRLEYVKNTLEYIPKIIRIYFL